MVRAFEAFTGALTGGVPARWDRHYLVFDFGTWKVFWDQDTYLAVEAHRRVPPGFEMGPFSYFPQLDDTRAAANHVLNHAGMLRALARAEAPLAAFSGYGLAIGAPAMRELSREEQTELWAALAARYDCIETVPDFGQGATKLGIWKRR